jgi:hypothetical protein
MKTILSMCLMHFVLLALVACGDGPADDEDTSEGQRATSGAQAGAGGPRSTGPTFEAVQRPLTTPPAIVESPIDADFTDEDQLVKLTSEQRDELCDWAATLRIEEPLNVFEACTVSGLERGTSESECLLFRNGCIEVTQRFAQGGLDEAIENEPPMGCARLTPPDGCTATVSMVKRCVREMGIARYMAARNVSCEEPEQLPLKFTQTDGCKSIQRVCLLNFGL